MVSATYRGVDQGIRSPSGEWRIKAEWNAPTDQWPALLEVRALSRRESLMRRFRCERVVGLAGSNPRFVSAESPGWGINQRLAMVQLTFVLRGSVSESLVLEGLWQERGRSASIERPFSIAATLLSTHSDAVDETPSSDNSEHFGECDVQHITSAILPLVRRLHDRSSLSQGERRKLGRNIAAYEFSLCDAPCRTGICSLRTRVDFLSYLGYVDLKDLLDHEPSGVKNGSPYLRPKKGVDAMSIKGLRLPGNYEG